MMTYESAELEHKIPGPVTSKDINDRLHLQRAHSNRLMLDLRQQIQWQNQVIRSLRGERDRLTSELASRLVFVEAQLRREQKHIESLLEKKDQFIAFQSLQIRSLKSLLSPSDSHAWDHQYSRCPLPCGGSPSRRSSMAYPLSKRYSVALDEYMRDSGVISRASPVIVRVDTADYEKKDCSRTRGRVGCVRTLSLPELRFPDGPQYENVDWVSQQVQCFATLHRCDNIMSPIVPHTVIDELSARRWTSDCDSEHSDSLDSGISSPSIQSRSRHTNGILFDTTVVSHANSSHPKRSPSLDVHANRPCSLSPHSAKVRSSSDLAEVNNYGVHRSLSDSKARDQLHPPEQRPPDKPVQEQKKTNRFTSSANRNFGTNHRSVTKPRDIKFRKLFKFRRRSDPAAAEGFANEDYMTV